MTRTKQQIASALLSGLDTYQETEIDEEGLIMLAEGRVNELTPQRRERLLIQVGSNPIVAELLTELHGLGLGQGIEEDSNPRMIAPFARITRTIWAIAACLAVSLTT